MAGQSSDGACEKTRSVTLAGGSRPVVTAVGMVARPGMAASALDGASPEMVTAGHGRRIAVRTGTGPLTARPSVPPLNLARGRMDRR
jgi:hypothetical protein